MIRIALTAAIVAVSAGAASSATIPCGDFTYTLEASSSAQCFTGNDTGANGISTSDSLFGMTGWVYSQKIAANGTDDTGSGGTKEITFTDVLRSGESGVFSKLGTWAVSDYSSIASQIMITIKKQSGYAAFLVNPGVTSGIWNTFKTSNEGDNNVISHSALFFKRGSSDPKDPEDPVNPVPLPAAGWMLLAGLGGLAALRRRKATAG